MIACDSSSVMPAQVQKALLLLRAHLADDGLYAHEEFALYPVERLVVVHASGRLPVVPNDEPHGVRDDHRELAEDARRYELEQDRVLHRLERAAERHPAHRLHLDEEDLGDENVAARELRHELVQERNVLAVEGVATGGEIPLVLAVLKEESALVAIDGQLGRKRDILIGMLVDEEVLYAVGPRDHHLAHATLDEIHDAHLALPQQAQPVVPLYAQRSTDG